MLHQISGLRVTWPRVEGRKDSFRLKVACRLVTLGDRLVQMESMVTYVALWIVADIHRSSPSWANGLVAYLSCLFLGRSSLRLS